MKNIKTRILLIIVGFSVIATGTAQKSTQNKASDNSIFWEVTGNGLKVPSYLFGTLHLLTSSFIDSLPAVLKKFNTCKTLAGEMKMDSTIMPKMQAASMLKETTLDQLLSKEDYAATAEWLKELTGYELSMFNKANPMTVSILLSSYVQQKVFPLKLTKPEPGMDEYFQTLSYKSGKKVVGLETIDDQLEALYSQFSNKRQAELLMAMVKQKTNVGEGMLQMITTYKRFKLDELITLMYDDSFTQKEVEVTLDNRNKNWMKQLPEMMKESPTFVAVGALHLPGKNGLVELLRSKGFTVNPIIIKGNS